MESIPYIFVGGGLGSILRYGLGRLAWMASLEAFWGTLLANVVGGLIMGLVMGWVSSKEAISPPVQLGLTVGLLGGLTTFSTFSHDVVALMRNGDLGTALFYALGSVIVCVSLCFVGVRISGAIFG